jgi:hypothetical protein
LTDDQPESDDSQIKLATTFYTDCKQQQQQAWKNRYSSGKKTSVIKVAVLPGEK